MTVLKKTKDHADVAVGPFSFFNSDRFLINREVDGELLRFELLENDTPVAKFSLVVDGKKAYSPKNAPYGSLEILAGTNPERVETFLDDVVSECRKRQVESLHVTSPPDCYPVPNTASFFHKLNTQPLYTDINQHIVVSEDPSSNFSKSEIYQLKRCQREGFVSKKEGIDALQEAHDLLVSARGRKRFPVTMSYAGLLEMFEKHPKHYHLFTVRNQQQLIAMAVAIRILPQVLYVFYLADHEDYLAESPTVMVVDEVLTFAVEKDYQLVDMGISSVKGALNKGLFEFKKNLGCVESRKESFLIRL